MIVQGNHNRSVETDNLENKTLASGKLSNDIWESISAFSNTDGGIIQLGVDISGVRMGIDSTVVDKVQQEVATLCSSGFNHKLYPDITVDSDNVIKRVHSASSCSPKAHLLSQ